MKTSRTGIDLIKKWEGCKLKAYRCSAGVLTIGYGHTSAAGAPKVVEGMIITQAQADEILVRDLVKYEAAVQKALTRSPNQNQFDAMVSLAFNIGPGAFAKSSLVRKFNAGDLAGAADAFLLWRKAGGKVLPGLENRRKDERSLFLRPVLATVKKPAEEPQKPVEPPRFAVPNDEPVIPIPKPVADAPKPSLWVRILQRLGFI